MKTLFLSALLGSAALCGAANAAVIFSEDFSGYAPTTIAHDATGGTNSGAFTPAATSTTGNSISTDYSFRVPNGQNGSGQADSMYDQGAWTIGTNPFAVHNLWIDTPNNTDPFLMLNGATTTGSGTPGLNVPTAYESGVISVAPGTYNFSYQQLNICCNANGPTNTPSNLELWYTIAGGPQNLVPLTVSTTSTANGWQTVSGSFTILGGPTSIRLGLVDNTSIASGNDFGVDNISLDSVAVPEPTSWALMILGFGGLGATLRRRRAGFAAA